MMLEAAYTGYFAWPSQFVHPLRVVLVCSKHALTEHCVLMLNLTFIPTVDCICSLPILDIP